MRYGSAANTVGTRHLAVNSTKCLGFVSGLRFFGGILLIDFVEIKVKNF